MRAALHLAAAAAAALAATGAGAQTVTFDAGGASPATGFTVINEFTSLAGLTNVTNTQIKTPPSDSSGAVPANSFPASPSYLSVLGGGSATYDLGTRAARSIQFDWGSIDRYNTLTVNTVGGQTYTVIPGTPTLGNVAFPNAADGNQFADGTNGLFTFTLANDKVSSVTFASGQNSFEVDRFAVAGVPEPATWALMIMGFGAVGGALRRRTVAKVAFA